MKKILVFTHYYLPGFKAGGPIRSISNMVASLSDCYNFYIVTSDRDSSEKEPYTGIEVDKWGENGKAKVYYGSEKKLGISTIKSLVNETQYDIIYLNSFFSMNFSFIPLIVSKYFTKKKPKMILAPRGEFSEGALKLKSFKKKVFIKMTKFLHIHNNIIWHASTDYESLDIQNTIKVKQKDIIIAPNIVLGGQAKNGIKEAPFNGIMKIVYISRISPKKNLEYAIRILSDIDKGIEFNIYGLVSDEVYWTKCQSLIRELPSNIKVFYHGAIRHEEVKKTLSDNHLFFLPTKGENFGHAIVEAFSAGIPVLISNTTPWRDLNSSGVGWDVDLESPGIFKKHIVEYYNKLQNGERIETTHISNWILNKLNIGRVINASKELFAKNIS